MIIDYIKMPEPLTVLGLMYGVFALFCFIQYIKAGCYNGISSETIKLIAKHYKLFISFIFLILLVIIFLDSFISNFCKAVYNVDIYTVLDFVNRMGEGWFVGGVLFTVSVTLYALGYTKHGFVFRMAFTTSIFAGLVNAICKFIFNRERPSVGDNPWHFFHFFVTYAKNLSDLLYAYNSMPSGHTITVISALTILYCYTNKKINQVILIFLGFAIMFARVYTINHWFSDVLTSGVMGVTIGYVVYKLKVASYE